MASLVSMLTHCLYYDWFAGGLQKFETVKTLLRMSGSSSKLLMHQIQFTVSRIFYGVNVEKLAAL